MVWLVNIKVKLRTNSRGSETCRTLSIDRKSLTSDVWKCGSITNIFSQHVYFHPDSRYWWTLWEVRQFWFFSWFAAMAQRKLRTLRRMLWCPTNRGIAGRIWWSDHKNSVIGNPHLTAPKPHPSEPQPKLPKSTTVPSIVSRPPVHCYTAIWKMCKQWTLSHTYGYDSNCCSISWRNSVPIKFSMLPQMSESTIPEQRASCQYIMSAFPSSTNGNVSRFG